MAASLPVFTNLEDLYQNLGTSLNLVKLISLHYSFPPREHIDYQLFGCFPAAIEHDILIACAPCSPTGNSHGDVVTENLYPTLGAIGIEDIPKDAAHVEEWHLDINKSELRWESYVKAGYYRALNHYFAPGETEQPIPVDLLVTASVPPGLGPSSNAEHTRTHADSRLPIHPPTCPKPSSSELIPICPRPPFLHVHPRNALLCLQGLCELTLIRSVCLGDEVEDVNVRHVARANWTNVLQRGKCWMLRFWALLRLCSGTAAMTPNSTSTSISSPNINTEHQVGGGRHRIASTNTPNAPVLPTASAVASDNTPPLNLPSGGSTTSEPGDDSTTVPRRSSVRGTIPSTRNEIANKIGPVRKKRKAASDEQDPEDGLEAAKKLKPGKPGHKPGGKK
ncbi:hypothetical protein CONPUDRAFT_151494 [Coniophora puteana RWD-64-598 SS2]|uniref:Galactokinase N-terminal domain-containing protein n=1 Tax=Coniophora puteana (strain RWD-64-598) TaxID=741705 RepID=A0A5M3MZL7_CONPW|nr:uncharacterized protein CONPUDRAFT_151494 [Coniophora puteana RWD-64-598 SS2]EIW84476.1 hypothetical protein CONPUDRAFT_151494 [Coniophora puteana RWD-64-598 SS2]